MYVCLIRSDTRSVQMRRGLFDKVNFKDNVFVIDLNLRLWTQKYHTYIYCIMS